MAQFVKHENLILNPNTHFKKPGRVACARPRRWGL